MDIEDISFYKYGQNLPEESNLLYFDDSFSLSVTEPNILYVCTPVCTVRIKKAFSSDAPIIYPKSKASPQSYPRCYSHCEQDRGLIEIYASNDSGTVYLLIGDVCFCFGLMNSKFLTDLIEKVDVFIKTNLFKSNL